MVLKKMTINQNLIDLDNYITYGEFKEAQLRLDIIEAQNDLSLTDHLNFQLLKLRILINNGYLNESFLLAETIYQDNLHHKRYIPGIDALLIKVEALTYLWRSKEAFNTLIIANELLEKFQDTQSPNILLRKALILLYKGRIYHLIDTELDRALDYYNQCAALIEQVGSIRHKLLFLRQLAVLYINTGDLDEAMEYGKKFHCLAEEYKIKDKIIGSINTIGHIYRLKGNLNQAIDYGLQSLSLADEIGFKQGIMKAHFILGYTYIELGNMELGGKHAKQCLILAKELNQKHVIARALGNISIYYRFMGEWEKSINYLEQCFSRFKEMKNIHFMTYTLLELISVSVYLENTDRANKYLKQLQKFDKQFKNKYISQRYRVAKAIILKNSDRPRHRGEAEILLANIVSEEIIEYRLTVMATLHLCELLLGDLRTTNDPDILKEVHVHLKKLQDQSLNHHAYWLLAETYVLESKIAIIELNLEDAHNHLNKAKHLVNVHGLHQSILNVLSEYETLLEHLSKWDSKIDQNIPYSERIEWALLESHITRMIYKRGKIVPNNSLINLDEPKQFKKIVISPITESPSILSQILHIYPKLKFDDISKAIINCLEMLNPVNISQLTEAVRNMRGRASRVTIRSRVNHLINAGIIEELDEGFGRQLRIISLTDD